MNDFTAAHVRRSYTIHLNAAPAEVFPLFEPLGETRWAAGWQPLPIYPASGQAQEGAVFKTAGHDTGADIWTITRHDPQKGRVSYLMVNPASRVVSIDVACQRDGDAATATTVSYTFTALSAEGNDYIAGMSEMHFREWLTSWELAINHYLTHGTALAHH